MRFRPPYPVVLADPSTVGYPQAVEQYLFRLRSFYDFRAAWHRRFYRYSGVTVILVGATLPLIATLSYAHKDLVVSLIGVVIAALTALRAFYRWDQSWILLRDTERTIISAWWDYHAKLAEIATDGDESARRVAAARELAMMLTEIREQEAEFFFKDLRFPSGKDGR